MNDLGIQVYFRPNQDQLLSEFLFNFLFNFFVFDSYIVYSYTSGLVSKFTFLNRKKKMLRKKSTEKELDIIRTIKYNITKR